MIEYAVIYSLYDFIYGQFTIVMNASRSYSRLTREALALLGARIKLGRKARRMPEKDLAARVGIARSTLQKIERGDPTVNIGLVFEAAVIVGVPLFVPDRTRLAPYLERVSDKLALLPKSVRSSPSAVHDDF
ncbi:MAG: helix-turn-helix transcriptional regulator [Rhodospirillaceae bacterium]|nr:helix-turn-helix transcriptional regulator [Rhodospirillaceae bacterium]